MGNWQQKSSGNSKIKADPKVFLWIFKFHVGLIAIDLGKQIYISRKSVNGEGEGLEDVVFWLLVVVLLFFAMMANECQWILWNPMGSKVGRIPLSIMANAPRVFSMPQKVWKDPKQNLLVWLINPLPPQNKCLLDIWGWFWSILKLLQGWGTAPLIKLDSSQIVCHCINSGMIVNKHLVAFSKYGYCTSSVRVGSNLSTPQKKHPQRYIHIKKKHLGVQPPRWPPPSRPTRCPPTSGSFSARLEPNRKSSPQTTTAMIAENCTMTAFHPESYNLI